MSRERFLENIEIDAKPGSYSVPFLADAGILDTPENVERWRSFLDTLSAKTRLGEDPETKKVGILYRAGAWLGDLVLADDVKAFWIIPDVREVRGSLVARNARVRNKSFNHRLLVRGDLVLHQDLLREDFSNVERSGDLVLSWPRRAEDLRVPPQRLAVWGVGENTRLRLEEGSFYLSEEQEEGVSVFLLRNVDSGQLYLWEFNAWEPVRGSVLGQEVLNQVGARLERFCKLAGLGGDFVLKNTKKIGHNIRKILRYLEFISASVAQETPALSAGADRLLGEVSDLLRDLEKNIYGPNPDAPNILIMLDVLSDRLAALVQHYDALPREKRPESHLQNDLEALAALMAEEVGVDEIFRHPLRIALFLDRNLSSKEARGALWKTLAPYAEAFETAIRILEEGERQGMEHALRWPVDILTRIKAVCPEAAQEDCEALEFELARLSEISPRFLLRSVQKSMQVAGFGEGAEKDMRLLSDLDRFKGSLDTLANSPQFLLEIVLADFQSALVDSLIRVQASLLSGERDEDPGVQVILARLKHSQPVDFLRFLQRRVNWEYSVLRRFNQNATPSKRPRESAAPRGENGDVRGELLARLNRICVLGGLGKSFLEQQPGTLGRNLEKMHAFVDLCVRSAASYGQDPRASKCRALLDDFAGRLQAMEQAFRRSDEPALRAVLAALGENYIQALRTALSLERRRFSALDLVADIRALEQLQASGLPLESLLGGTDKAVQFLISVLETTAAKQELFTLIQPINEALAALFKTQEGLRLSMADVLTRFERASQAVTRTASGPATLEALALLRGLLERLRELPLSTVLPRLHQAAAREGGEAGGRDAAFLERLTQFRQGGLDRLALTPAQVPRLLLVHVSPQSGAEIRSLAGRGEFERASAPAILTRILARLRWRESVVQAYNTLAKR